MKKIARLLSAMLLVSIALLGLGCFGGSKDNAINPNAFQSETVAVSEKPVVDVYWDASVSMAGYTTVAADNLFRELPDEVMDVGGSLGEVNFFRFGTEIVPMQSGEYRKYINQEPYTELANSIKNVVDGADPTHLSVVVTDLFESDAAWSAVSQKLQEKYFKDKCAVAVLAFKAPFNGTVYDVGLDGAKFNYDSAGDPAKYRPVYLLIMGPDVHVNSFLKRCQEKNLVQNKLEMVKFSSNLMETQADVKNMPEIETENLIEIEKLEFPEDYKAVEYKISAKDEPCKVVRSFKYKPNKYGCQIDINKIKPVVQIRFLNPETEEWEVCERKAFEVSIEPEEDEPETYDVKVTFVAQDSLKDGAVNVAMVYLVPEYDGLILPAWVQEWNMSATAAADPRQFDGSKTANLSRIISSLKDSVLTVGQPSLIRQEMYFDLR